MRRAHLLATGFCILAACARPGSDELSRSPSPVELASRGPETPSAQGTESSAGGGNAVVCFDDPSIPEQILKTGGDLENRWMSHIRSIEILDLYSARQTRQATGIAPELIQLAPSQSPQAYVDQISSRFSQVIPSLSLLIRQGKAQFREDSIRWSQSGLRKINDARLDEQLPQGCALATMAAQVGIGETSQLLIDARLYHHKRHTDLSRAVMWLHEFLYVMFRKEGHVHSAHVRNVVGYLITRKPSYKSSELVALLNTPRGLSQEQLHVKLNGPSSFGTYTHVFASAVDLWLADVANTMNSSLQSQYLHYLEAHPEVRHLIQRADEALSVSGKHCVPRTLGGCREAVSASQDPRFSTLNMELLKAQQPQWDEILKRLRSRWDSEFSRERMRKEQAFLLNGQDADRMYDYITQELLWNLAYEVDSLACDTEQCLPIGVKDHFEWQLSTFLTWRAALNPVDVEVQ